MAADLLSDLRSIQALLGTPASDGKLGAAAPARLTDAAAQSTDDESEPEAAVPLPSSLRQAPPTNATRELEREVGALRQAAAEDANRIRALEEALASARQDGSLIAQRLQAQVAAKQEDSTHLCELVFSLREEADALRAQLAASSQAAADADRSRAGSLEQIQEVAAEWRRLGEEAQEVAADERARSAALQAEVERLQAERQGLERALQAERAAREAAAADAAGAASSAPLVSALRERCAMERNWRKAVCQWLQGEMQTKAELERVLLRVGTAVRVGTDASPASGLATRCAPPLPSRRMVASQLVPPDVMVTVVHSPAARAVNPAAAPVAGGHRSTRDTDWRQHFKETMTAFDERHKHLQAELSTLRREALQPGRA